ncbi:MAG: hypothetical protein IKM70_01340 [Firmicutes bacterium]|nr:hypothetical protein [Bacillota bacterium]
MSRKNKKDKNQVAYADRDGDKSVTFVETKYKMTKGELIVLAVLGTVAGLLCLIEWEFGLLFGCAVFIFYYQKWLRNKRRQGKVGRK